MLFLGFFARGPKATPGETDIEKRNQNYTHKKNRESVLHVLSESSEWLDRWCKDAEGEEKA